MGNDTRQVNHNVQQTVLETIAGYSGDVFGANSLMNTLDEKLEWKKNHDMKVKVLTFFGELVRNGTICLANPHVTAQEQQQQAGVYFATEQRRKSLEHASRDPLNQAGYLAYLDREAPIDPLTRGYVEEALNTYLACCYKATAVMIGAATENLVLDLRDELVRRMKTTGRAVDKKMESQMVKTAFEKVAERLLDDLKKDAATKDEALKNLYERADAKLHSIAAEFRKTRNDAGHPASLDPISEADVHCNLLLFPAVAKLIGQLKAWVIEHYHY